MREILDDIDRWRSDGKKVAVARVVKIEGSGPRDPVPQWQSTKMAKLRAQ